MTPREFLAANMAQMIAVFDQHEASVYPNGQYRCTKCKTTMSAAEWEQHLADVIAEQLDPAQLVLL
jgi:hypothetical protein